MRLPRFGFASMLPNTEYRRTYTTGASGSAGFERLDLEVAEDAAAVAAQRDVLRDPDLDVAEDGRRLDHDLPLLEERLGEVDLDAAEDREGVESWRPMRQRPLRVGALKTADQRSRLGVRGAVRAEP